RTVVLTTGSELVTLTSGFSVTLIPTDTHAFAYVLCRRSPSSLGSREDSQILSVIDTVANEIVATIPAGRGCFCVGPDGVVVSPDAALVYGADEVAQPVSVTLCAS